MHDHRRGRRCTGGEHRHSEHFLDGEHRGPRPFELAASTLDFAGSGTRPCTRVLIATSRVPQIANARVEIGLALGVKLESLSATTGGTTIKAGKPGLHLS